MRWPAVSVMVACVAMTPLSAQAGDGRNLAALPTQLDHVALKVDDQQRSIDFYSAVFNLKETPTPFGPGGPRWLELPNGASLHIQSGRSGMAPPPRGVHFAFAVGDMDAFVARLRKLNVPWYGFEGERGRIDDRRADHVKQVYIQDPDGYWIEVNDKLKLGRR